jgi:hypothetical protein
VADAIGRPCDYPEQFRPIGERNGALRKRGRAGRKTALALFMMIERGVIETARLVTVFVVTGKVMNWRVSAEPLNAFMSKRAHAEGARQDKVDEYDCQAEQAHCPNAPSLYTPGGYR